MIRGILNDPTPGRTRISLIDANKTEEDILCRKEIDALHAAHGEHRFHRFYTLSVVPDGWAYGRGRITDTMLIEHLPSPGEHAAVFACGPEGMIKEALAPGLRRCGWDIDRQLIVF